MNRRIFVVASMISPTIALAQASVPNMLAGVPRSLSLYESENKLLIDAPDLHNVDLFDGDPSVKLAPSSEQEDKDGKVLVWDFQRLGVNPEQVSIAVRSTKSLQPSTFRIPKRSARCVARYPKSRQLSVQISCE